MLLLFVMFALYTGLYIATDVSANMKLALIFLKFRLKGLKGILRFKPSVET